MFIRRATLSAILPVLGFVSILASPLPVSAAPAPGLVDQELIHIVEEVVTTGSERYLNFDRAVWAIIRPDLAARDAA